MAKQTSLVKILLASKEKILDHGKYNIAEFEDFINELTDVESSRQRILEKIEEHGTIDIPRLKKELEISEKNLLCTIEYLKELGFLEFIGEKPRFFQELVDISKQNSIFPNVSIIKEKNLCSGCGICASICPIGAIVYSKLKLKFEFNEELCIDCGLCYTCCPRTFFPEVLMTPEEHDDPDIKFLEQFNYYQDIFSAQTTDERMATVAPDIGIVTTLLKMAFQQKLIDGDLTLIEGEDPRKPLPHIIEDADELLNTPVSKLKYPIAPSLKMFQNCFHYDKLAVVGAPCIMKALKKVSFYPFNRPYCDNIALKIGLFCNRRYGWLGCSFCDDLTAIHADISIGSIGSDPGWVAVFIRTKKGAEFFQKALDLNKVVKKEIKEDSEIYNSLSEKAKSKLKKFREFNRPKMIEQDPNIRKNNFEEVPKGLTLDMVKLESNRCLQCGNPLCISGCPVNIRIPKFIKLLKEENYIGALYEIKSHNLLPAICGRVCPQESQCEKKCILNGLGEPIAIGYLERFIADWEREENLKECPECAAPKGIKVAVIGSGPAGLTCAGELAMNGYDVTIFEAFHAGGGVLTYGIPEFRLPKDIVKSEIETLKMLNVKVEYNVIIGKTLTIDDLKEMGFKAFFIGVGAGLPIFIEVPGLTLNGVLTANEFLTRSNLMKAFKFPDYDTPVKIGKIVTVLGGGNVALDSARTALRLGAEKVIIVYRRSEAEMPARKEEYHHALEEGVVFQFLTNPVGFIGDENDNLKQMEVIKMELGEPDESGRRRPIPIENSEYLIDTDTIIIGIGARANPIITKSIPELKISKQGYIEADEKFQTNIEEIFAGGDIVTGSATVISAMGAGKRAAHGIDKYLQEKYLDKK